jgi:nucleoside transporter
MTEAEPIAPMTADSSEARLLTVRLSVLIFLPYAIMGAWVPVFSLHLKNLHFSPEETAWASGASAIGALIAPMIWGQIADRWLAMQRCISLCALADAVGLWLLGTLREPTAVIAVSIGVWFFLIPTYGLTASFIFRQLSRPERQYGFIRMWGTVGWMAASWCLTSWFAWHRWYNEIDPNQGNDFGDSLRLASLAALVLVMYALTLPHTPPGKAHPTRAWFARLIDAPLSALHLFRNRLFAVYCVCMFGFNITLPFTIQLNPLLLNRLGVNESRLPTYLTIAQTTEVLCLYLLPILLLRFGTKTVMLFGGMSWTIGLALLSVGEPTWVVLSSLVTHGVFICCFFIAGQVFVNRQATHDIRASAQGVLLFISGSGLLLGHLLVGWIRDLTNDSYSSAYLFASALAAMLVTLLVFGFTQSTTAAASQQVALVPDSEIS